MRDPGGIQEKEPVPLALAGLSQAKVEAQLQKLLRSEAFHRKGAEKKLLTYLVRESLAGNRKRLLVPAITEALFAPYVPGDSRVRRETGKLRDTLDDYYSSEDAAAEDIRFSIPLGQYVVYASTSNDGILRTRPIDVPLVATILEPVNDALVYANTIVRGYLEGLDLDLRVWLVVRPPDCTLYPACLVRRKNQPYWEEEIVIGRPQFGNNENCPFEVLLVALTIEGDFAFYEYLKSGKDGFGGRWPRDSKILDTKRYTRRDFR